MKSKLHILYVLTALLLSPSLSYAYDFKVNGVFYAVVSTSDLTCVVVRGDKFFESYKSKVVIPDEVEYKGKRLKVIGISDGAFSQERVIESLTIGKNVKRIEHDAFEDCTSLKKLILEDSDESIFIDNYYSSIEAYGEPGFADCQLEEIYIGRPITFPSYSYMNGPIEFRPFIKCYAFKKVTYGDKVKIMDLQFGRLDFLEEVVLGKSISEITTSYPFGQFAKNIRRVYCYNPIPPEANGPIFAGMVCVEATLFVPKGSKEAYQSADYWSDFWDIQEIDDNTSITIPTSGIPQKDTNYLIDGIQNKTGQKGINIRNGNGGKTIKVMVP